jgi:MFS family permease
VLTDPALAPDHPVDGVLGARFRWITIGMCALVFLAAFEALAVTTVMPTISRELDGASLYALAFAGPLAVGVIGMVLAGNWSDRAGPTPPLFTAVGLFATGLLLAGLSHTMPMLVVGRLVHGLGGGGLTVALYVMLAQIYPARLHPSIFAGFAAAWVIPSLIGPFAAGLVAQYIGWQWVFLGVIVLVVPAMIMVLPALRMVGRPAPATDVPWSLKRLSWSAIAAGAVLAVDLVSPLPTALRWICTVAAAALALLALRPLLPRHTLRAAAGLPTVILLRGLVGGAFGSAEVYLPYLLTRHYRWTPSVAGLALTAGALAWSVGSAIQGRYAVQLTHRRAVSIGAVLVSIAIANTWVTTIVGLPALVAVVGWTLGGFGMGLTYPRLSTSMLALSSERDRGFNSSALAIADAIGSALAIAAAGLAFGLLVGTGGRWPFVGALAVALALAVVALAVLGRLPGGRVGSGPKTAPPEGSDG